MGAEALLPRLSQEDLQVRGGEPLHELRRLLDEAVSVADEGAVVDDTAPGHETAVDVVGPAVDRAVVLDHVAERPGIHVLDHEPIRRGVRARLAPRSFAAQEDFAALPDPGRIALREEPAELVQMDPRRLAMDAHPRAGAGGESVEERDLRAAPRSSVFEVGEVAVAQTLLPVHAQPAQLAIAQGGHLGARAELAERIRHPDAVATQHPSAPPCARALAEADGVVDVLHPAAVVGHRDPASPELDPHPLGIRVERVVHQLADHVVRLVVRHALGEDHVRHGRRLAAAESALH